MPKNLSRSSAQDFNFESSYETKFQLQIRRRRRMTNRPSTTNAVSAAQKAEETRQAILLFAIVILFVCCHSLRILLNVNELLTLKVVRSSIKNGCFGVPFWALVGVPVSHFLITFNSSVNFFIYCFMCTTFRRILLANIKKVKMVKTETEKLFAFNLSFFCI